MRHRPGQISGQQAPREAATWAESVIGWMSRAELLWLADEARHLAPGDVWLEVGIWKGRSLAAVVLAVQPGVQVVGVDHWLGEPGVLSRESAALARDTWEDTRRALCAARPDVNFCAICEPSVEAAQHFDDGSLSVVFIDGSHDAKNVNADLAAWRPKLRPGGLLCGHDRGEPGVAQAIATLKSEGLAVEVWPGSIWHVRLSGPAEVPAPQAVAPAAAPGVSASRAVPLADGARVDIHIEGGKAFLSATPMEPFTLVRLLIAAAQQAGATGPDRVIIDDLNPTEAAGVLASRAAPSRGTNP